MICVEYDHAFAKDMTQKFIAYQASFTSASATSEPSSASINKGKNTAPSAAAVSKPPTASMLLQDKPFRDPFEDESEDESEADENDDSDFELDASLPKEPSDRKLRPRASRVITIDD